MTPPASRRWVTHTRTKTGSVGDVKRPGDTDLGIEGADALSMLAADVLGDTYDHNRRLTAGQAAQVLAHLGTIATPQAD